MRILCVCVCGLYRTCNPSPAFLNTHPSACVAETSNLEPFQEGFLSFFVCVALPVLVLFRILMIFSTEYTQSTYRDVDLWMREKTKRASISFLFLWGYRGRDWNRKKKGRVMVHWCTARNFDLSESKRTSAAPDIIYNSPPKKKNKRRKENQNWTKRKCTKKNKK